MNTAEDQGELEKAMAEKIIADTPLMDGIESITVELGEDHAGDPAMWLVFHLRRGLEPDDEWLTRLNEFSGVLEMRLIHSGLDRFPYTRLRQAA